MSEKLLASTIELRDRLRAFVGAVAEITDCGHDVDAIVRADEAIEAWNRRTPAPEGEAWRTVPSEPTEAMIAAANALWGEGTGVNYVQLEPEDFYAAMLAASPVVPAPEGEAWTARHIVFDGPPDHNGPRFIEVETPEGKSVNAGEWRQRPDNLWELVIASPVVPVGVSEEHRQRVAEIVEAAIERHAPANSIRHTLDDVDAIIAALRPTDTGANHD